MELKPEIAKVLGVVEREMVKAALAELTQRANDAQSRWRVTQLKNVLLVKSAEDLDE